MTEETQIKFSTSNPNKLDLILLILHRIQEDLHLAKCEIRTSIREVADRQDFIHNSMHKLTRGLSDIDDRLHGLELRQDRQNSST